jgi:hypothetical protein
MVFLDFGSMARSVMRPVLQDLPFLKRPRYWATGTGPSFSTVVSSGLADIALL